uniref:Uncharacterized protein n=1 Tax=Magallana gigas TaxID=29159 RepID=K1QTX0_MAGGI
MCGLEQRMKQFQPSSRRKSVILVLVEIKELCKNNICHVISFMHNNTMKNLEVLLIIMNSYQQKKLTGGPAKVEERKEVEYTCRVAVFSRTLS